MIPKKFQFIINKFNISPIQTVTPYGNGRVNETFLVKTTKEKYIIQKLHPTLKPAVLRDIQAMTDKLKKHGIQTPVLVKTKKGGLHAAKNNARWRMFTYIPGKSFERAVSVKRAQNGAALLGKTHTILTNYDYSFKHRIPHFHDAEKIMQNLAMALKKYYNNKKCKALYPIAYAVLAEYQKLTPPQDLPNRVIHGDPKFSNIRYDARDSAIALLDLDTFGRNKIIVDIGDMIRSWCNKKGEDAASPTFDIKIFAAIMKGYCKEAHFLTMEERKSIPYGIQIITLELAARFLIDAFEETYFTLDASRYKTLYYQNKAKALNQLAFHESFLKRKKKVDEVLKKYT